MAAPKFTPFQTPLSVPLALSSRKNWIGWRLVHNPDDPDNPKKMPVVLVPGVPVNDYLKPHAHVTYEEALAQVGPLKLAGVGFVMTLDCGMIGVDLDKCRDPATGAINAREQEVIDRRETYFEISPSGRGVRFFSLTDVPLRKTVIGGGVEMYSTGRYLTFTGDRIIGTPLEIGRAPYAIETLMQWAADANTMKAASKATAAGQGTAAAPGSFEEIADREAYRKKPMGRINQAAMADLEAWVPELLPDAEKTAAGGYRVKSKDLGRPLQEDLSISPDGIKDFGVHDLGDAREGRRSPIDVVMEWSDPPMTDPVDAATWLGVRVGVPFDAASTGSSGGSPEDDGPLSKLVPHTFVQGKVLPPREWVVPGWVPMNKVTLLQGDGGDGKTLLMRQLQAATALGELWVGLPCEEVVSCGFYTEDDDYDVEEGQMALDAHYGKFVAGTGKMFVFERDGEENELIRFPGRERKAEPTRFYRQVREAVLDLKARLTTLDVAVDLYGGNEIVRTEVRALFRLVKGLCKEMNGAAVMSMHVSQSGIKTGGGHSGSTDWSNAARSRLYLNRPDEDSNINPDARTLTRKKSNYAALGDTVRLRWERGVLVPLGGQSAGAQAFKRSVEDVFMDILDAVIAEKQTVCHKSKSGTYAPLVFSRRPFKDREGYGRGDFERAMHGLLQSRQIVITEYGKPSKKMEKLERPGSSRFPVSL